MKTNRKTVCTAFAGVRCVASGDLSGVAQTIKKAVDAGEREHILVFDDHTSEPIELDLRGDVEDVLARLDEPEDAKADIVRGRGRPKLGVVSREVTLMPRHWEWLSAQPGGASVTLRKLVEQARRSGGEEQSDRQKQNVVYGFMHAIAGDLPGYEEALRALFSGDDAGLREWIEGWPEDIVTHIDKLLGR